MSSTLVHRVVSSLWPLRFPGKVRLLDRLVPRLGSREARVFGCRMTLDLSDLMERMIYLGTYEREETGIAWRWLKPGMTFLDVGANVGYFTLLASRRVGQGGRVISIEPGPHVHGRLARVVAGNGLKAELHRIGLSDRDVHAVYSSMPPPPAHIFTRRRWARYDRVWRARGGRQFKRLDDCLDDWRVDSVDLLKIDVEGHEAKVFAGGRGCARLGPGAGQGDPLRVQRLLAPPDRHDPAGPPRHAHRVRLRRRGGRAPVRAGVHREPVPGVRAREEGLDDGRWIMTDG